MISAMQWFKCRVQDLHATVSVMGWRIGSDGFGHGVAHWERQFRSWGGALGPCYAGTERCLFALIFPPNHSNPLSVHVMLSPYRHGARVRATHPIAVSGSLYKDMVTRS